MPDTSAAVNVSSEILVHALAEAVWNMIGLLAILTYLGEDAATEEATNETLERLPAGAPGARVLLPHFRVKRKSGPLMLLCTIGGFEPKHGLMVSTDSIFVKSQIAWRMEVEGHTTRVTVTYTDPAQGIVARIYRGHLEKWLGGVQSRVLKKLKRLDED